MGIFDKIDIGAFLVEFSGVLKLSRRDTEKTKALGFEVSLYDFFLMDNTIPDMSDILGKGFTKDSLRIMSRERPHVFEMLKVGCAKVKALEVCDG